MNGEGETMETTDMQVEIQANGIIRRAADGQLIGRLTDSMPFEDLHKLAGPGPRKLGDDPWQPKTLHNSDVSGTHQNVPDVKVFGDGDTFSLWVKASSEREGWMKSTKVANVPGGCLVQTETQQRNPDGSYALSQALAFVPGASFDRAAHDFL